MPKTNHNRNFVDERDYTCPPGDHCRGKHGAAKKKRGEKKFRRSRQRFHQNQQTALLVDEDNIMMPTKHDMVMKDHSKLRKTSNSGPMHCTKCGRNASMLLIVVPLEVQLCRFCAPRKPEDAYTSYNMA
jgi:hypothetical protein